MNNKNIKHAAIVPLIGGFSIAATKIIGNYPDIIFSWPAFKDNDELYLRYLNKKNISIPYLEIKDGVDYSEYKNLDIVHGILPCAGLSMSGNLKKGARENSPVNDWMIKATEFALGEIKPKIYVFENAPTLFTDIGEGIRKKIMSIAIKEGYAATFYRTDTLLHGIPQRRPRTYTVLIQGENAPLLDYYNKPCPSVAEYLQTIPEGVSGLDQFATKEPYIDDFEIVRFSKMKFGDNWRQKFLDTREHLTSYDFLNRNGLLEEYQKFVLSEENPNPASVKDIAHVIKKIGMGKNFRLSHRVLCVDKHHIYAVIGEMMERNIHPTEDRRMNMREYMHLMGMPHDFDLLEPREFGKLPQNVPVNTSADIINECIEIIKNNRQLSTKRFEMQDNIKMSNMEQIKTKHTKLF